MESMYLSMFLCIDIESLHITYETEKWILFWPSSYYIVKMWARIYRELRFVEARFLLKFYYFVPESTVRKAIAATQLSHLRFQSNSAYNVQWTYLLCISTTHTNDKLIPSAIECGHWPSESYHFLYKWYAINYPLLLSSTHPQVKILLQSDESCRIQNKSSYF